MTTNTIDDGNDVIPVAQWVKTLMLKGMSDEQRQEVIVVLHYL